MQSPTSPELESTGTPRSTLRRHEEGRDGGKAERPSLEVALPAVDCAVAQDEEWCYVRAEDGSRRRIRFHDYDEVFSIPGLYERLFRDLLECRSPVTVRRLLENAMEDVGASGDELRILDLGAGNGMVGEEIAALGAQTIVGVDILDAAAEAAQRDRPEVYEAYLVTDMTQLSDRERMRLQAFDFNCLTCVAALGFGDIPTDAFVEAYNLVSPGGFVAFNIKEDFVTGPDSSGFSDLMNTICNNGTVDVRHQERYRHRLSITGDPLYYVAMVGVKQDDIAVVGH